MITSRVKLKVSSAVFTSTSSGDLFLSNLIELIPLGIVSKARRLVGDNILKIISDMSNKYARLSRSA